MKKVIIGIIIVALLVVIGIIVRGNKNQQGSSTNQQTNTVQQTTSPSPQENSQASASSQTTQEQNAVTLTSSGFSPKTLTIKAGTTVNWINKSRVDATVNSSPHPTHTDYPPLNLGSFPDGGTLTLTFNKPGTYKYHNHLNSSQFGSIIVE